MKERHPNQEGKSSVVSADDMILYRENPMDSPKTLSELINTFSKVAALKINIQLYFYTLTQTIQREIKKALFSDWFGERNTFC